MDFAFPVAAVVTVRGVPLPRFISSGFGLRSSPTGSGTQQHSGIDFPADEGTRVFAVLGGTVATVYGNHPDAGTFVEIDHGNGYWTRYLHLSAVNVAKGQQVKMGDVVGLSGGMPGKPHSGRSTGPHLHFEIWEGRPFGGGRAVNPIELLTREATEAAKQYWLPALLAGVGISGLLIWRFRPEWFRGR